MHMPKISWFTRKNYSILLEIFGIDLQQSKSFHTTLLLEVLSQPFKCFPDALISIKEVQKETNRTYDPFDYDMSKWPNLHKAQMQIDATFHKEHSLYHS